jgi:hypothetical protein
MCLREYILTKDKSYLEEFVMSKFYGSVQGNRGAATRGGYNIIKTSAQSYDGSVITELTYEEDILMVRVSTDEGSSSYGSTIFYGTFDEFVNKLKA